MVRLSAAVAAESRTMTPERRAAPAVIFVAASGKSYTGQGWLRG
jgi:hypothetical protein